MLTPLSFSLCVAAVRAANRPSYFAGTAGEQLPGNIACSPRRRSQSRCLCFLPLFFSSFSSLFFLFFSSLPIAPKKSGAHADCVGVQERVALAFCSLQCTAVRACPSLSSSPRRPPPVPPSSPSPLLSSPSLPVSSLQARQRISTRQRAVWWVGWLAFSVDLVKIY